MRAIVQDRYGDSERAAARRACPTPCPAPARCSCGSAPPGVDRGTWHVMTGRPLAARLALGLRAPT